MKDPELYDFFSKGSGAFDEMPSADLWDKIDAGLKEGKKVKPVTSLLIKALLFLAVAALVVWICLQLTEKTLPSENEIQNNRPVEENKIHAQDSLIKYDSLKELPGASPVLKTPAVQVFKNTPQAEDADYAEDGQANEKPAEPVYKLEVTNQETEEVATTTAFKNRIVVRTTKKLTASQYDLLIQSALEKNKDQHGMMLIIIAPGHATYRKMIPGERVSASKTMDLKKTKTEIADTLSIQPGIVTFTNTDYLSKVLSTEKNAEVYPVYPGGVQQFYNYISKNFKAPEEFLNGKIIISFSIETDGTLSDFKVMKDLGYGTGAEAIRVIKNCPGKWKPAYKDGKAIKATYTLPIMISTQ